MVASCLLMFKKNSGQNWRIIDYYTRVDNSCDDDRYILHYRYCCISSGRFWRVSVSVVHNIASRATPGIVFAQQLVWIIFTPRELHIALMRVNYFRAVYCNRKVTVDVASHWPCVTNFRILSPMDSRQDKHPTNTLHGYGALLFYFRFTHPHQHHNVILFAAVLSLLNCKLWNLVI